MVCLQILLRYQVMNENAQMHDWTTPLMVAVQPAVKGIVEDLSRAYADVNTTHMNGKLSVSAA